MSRRRSTILVSIVLAAALAIGCGDDGGSAARGEKALTAVATTTQVADFAREVGGDRVDVRQILQPNSDPHGYEPRPSDVASVTEADVVMRSGGDLDAWLDGLLDNAGADVPQVELIQAVERRDGGHAGEGSHDHVGEEEHDHGDSADPHWWQDPRNAIAAVAAIRDALAAADPDGRAEYERNAAAYIRQLRRLDRAVAACIDEVPAPQRKLVTTHDALGYYADRYGIEVVGALIPSQSTAAQPSAGDIEELVDQIEREQVEAIFPESSIDPRLERAVSRETGATVGKALWADTLGGEGSGGATYVESIRSNTAALVEGLTGGAQRCRP
ncbi:MAG TPA: metal ABC transporter substrate-binding protein [Thermoleophilaceae bacterium]|nr:metal ABC transporter substrate-binding protein [Thermoleophilaceae bacterium]